jgi:hypothetical protein
VQGVAICLIKDTVIINEIASIHLRLGKLYNHLEFLKAKIPAVEKESRYIDHVPTVDIDVNLL